MGNTPRRSIGLSRLNVLALLLDQFRFLRSLSTNKPAWVVRALVVLVAPVFFVVSLLLHWQMQSVGSLVEALGLLAGVFISAFAVVFGLRVSFAARPSRVLEQRSARLMDESALTLLAAGLLSGIDAIWLAGVSLTLPEGSTPSELETAITVAISSLVVVYFLLSVRRMHVLYTDTFLPFWRVRDAVHGAAKQSDSNDASDVEQRRNA